MTASTMSWSGAKSRHTQNYIQQSNIQQSYNKKASFYKLHSHYGRIVMLIWLNDQDELTSQACLLCCSTQRQEVYNWGQLNLKWAHIRIGKKLLEKGSSKMRIPASCPAVCNDHFRNLAFVRLLFGDSFSSHCAMKEVVNIQGSRSIDGGLTLVGSWRTNIASVERTPASSSSDSSHSQEWDDEVVISTTWIAPALLISPYLMMMMM